MQRFRECLGSDRRLDQHAGPAEDFSGRERRRAGHKLPNFSRGRRKPSHARLIDGDLYCAGGDAIERNPAFDLAAFELGCELLARLLDILHLLAHLLDQHLELERRMRQFGVNGLGA